MPNRLIDQRYELLRVLRSSAASVLHYGWDHRDQRAVAVREIITEHVRPPEAIESLLSEAGRLLGVKHPNLVRVFALRQDTAGHLYVITEYLDGTGVDTLLERLNERQKRLPAALALTIARQTLQAVERLQAARMDLGPSYRPVILHPAKIILVAGGEVKLIGFGLRGTQGGQEPTYLSPEEARGETADQRAEFYTLGVVLYELLIGRLPYRRDDPEGMLPQVQAAAIDRSTLPAVGVSKRVVKLIDGMLTAHPETRFATTDALLEALRVASEVEPDDGSAAALADLVEALQAPEEERRRRQLLLTRGSNLADTESVTTSPVSPPPRAKDSSGPIASRRTADTGPATLDTWVERFDTEAPAPRRRGTRRRSGRAYIVAVLATCILGYAFADLYWGFGPLARFSGLKPTPDTGREGWEVVTVPPGAELRVNGVWAGTTPCDLGDLSPGPATIRLSIPGLVPIDTVFNISADEGPLELDPFVFSCRVHFSSVPTGANILVNGHELSDLEAARFALAVSETVQVEMTLGGETPMSPARLNPLAGIIPPSDTAVWRWRPPREDSPAELLGVFSRTVEIRSRPLGAFAFFDGDSIPAGKTPLSWLMPYGDHTVRLSREPFMDYRFAITVGQESPSVYAPVLRRTVHLRAVSPSAPDTDIGAEIAWIKEGAVYLKTPFDNLATPYSIPLDGVGHEIRFRHRSFADTTVRLDAATDRLTVVMRPETESGGQSSDNEDDTDLEEGWVQFRVRGPGGPIAEAEVIGVEKDTGVIVRYGPTDDAGQLIARVPIGDYEWRATKIGLEGRSNGERVKGDRKLKEITLKMDER
jgi:serine/threonine protein kinase